jgi:PAS domain S-box-containing protein
MTKRKQPKRVDQRIDSDRCKEKGILLPDHAGLSKTLLESLPEAGAVIDLNGNVIMVNRLVVKLHGFSSPEEMTGKNIIDLSPPREQHRGREMIRKVIETGSALAGEYTLLRKDGSSFCANLSASLVRDISGNPLVFVAIFHDNAEHKLMEDRMSQEKELLSVTMRSISDAVITVNVHGNILFLNRRAEELTGWENEAAHDKPLDSIINVDEKAMQITYLQAIKKVVETGTIVERNCNRVVFEKSGYERKITETFSPLVNRHNVIVGVVLVLDDITEREKLEKELFRSRKLETVGTMARGIAHDFNNILTAITGNLFLAKINAIKESDAYRAILEAEKAAFRATKFTNRLLTFAKEETTVKEQTPIREIIDDVVGYSITDSRIEVRIELPDDLWDIPIDRGQIDQVFNNVLVNAEQAMPEGGTVVIRGENVTIPDTSVNSSYSHLPLQPGIYVMISIEDNGIGIHPDDMDKVFDPYYTTKHNRTGLGLTISYSIVRRHNGLLYARSKLGIGTTITLYLPTLAPAETEKIKKSARTHGKILFMDDEALIRTVVDQILQSIGYTVRFASNGAEAVKIYKEEKAKGMPFDAVILDFTVPYGMGGRETVKELIAFDPKVRAIISSGYTNDPIMTEFSAYGFKDCVSKPFMVEELNKVLRRVIAIKD